MSNLGVESSSLSMDGEPFFGSLVSTLTFVRKKGFKNDRS